MTTISFVLVSFSLLLYWSGGIAFTPVIKDAEFTECKETEPEPLDEDLVSEILNRLPPPGCSPHLTCRDVLRCNSSASSGYYQIQAANGSAVQVYCDMEGTNCGREGGWMRVAHLNITDQSSQCPDGFKVETVNSTYFCIRNTTQAGCRSVLYKAYGVTYTQVCGYARGYSYHSPDAFRHDCSNEVLCVDGITITYGNPLSHVWTYVADVNESGPFSCYNTTSQSCSDTDTPTKNLVHTNFYCESGTSMPSETWFTNDPLWDGDGCGGHEGPCCNHTRQPWFQTNTRTPTMADISAWVCLDEDTSDENVGIEQLEIYVK